MRVKCQCGNGNLVIQKQILVTDSLSHFYGDCKSCGKRFRGSTTIDYEVDNQESDLKSRILSVFGKFSPEDQENIIEQLDPA